MLLSYYRSNANQEPGSATCWYVTLMQREGCGGIEEGVKTELIG